MRVGFYFYAHPDFEISNLFQWPGAETAENAEKMKQVESDFEVYQDYMNAATDASSGDALMDMIQLGNVGMPSDRCISLSSTYSYAVGGMNPWGYPYFFTAKKLRPGTASSVESTIGSELPGTPVPVQDGLIFRGYYNKPNGEAGES